MKSKTFAGAFLIFLGSVLTFKGVLEVNQSLINAGIGGVFLGIVVLSFSSPSYVKYDTLERMLKPYIDLTRSLVKALELKTKAVYIPPFGNLPEGGVFIPVHENFDIDIARLNENSVFVTDVGREKELGVLTIPLGKELVKAYEEYIEMDLANAGIEAVENASAVLRSLGLAKSVTIEKNDKIKVYVEGVKMKNCSSECEAIACPICSSVLLALAKSLNELIIVERFEIKSNVIEITVKKIGRPMKWM